MTNVRLLAVGTTSGIQVLKTQSDPAANTEYDLYVRASLSGLVGNITLMVDVNDGTSVTGVVLTVTHWVAIDLTTEQGAGYESSEADMYTFVAWRDAPYAWATWLDIDTHFQWWRIADHGLSSGDTIGYYYSVTITVLR